jgi:hypothetical protein
VDTDPTDTSTTGYRVKAGRSCANPVDQLNAPLFWWATALLVTATIGGIPLLLVLVAVILLWRVMHHYAHKDA